MCILLYVKLIWCSGVPEIYAQLGGYICHGYMCILLYVTLIWCTSVPEIYASLGGMSAMGICAFLYMWHRFGVVVFQRSMLDWGADLPIRTLTVEMWNCHSWPLDVSTRGVDLPVDLPRWAVTVKIWNCHSDPLADLLGGRSANFEHTWRFMLCFTDGPFVYTKDQIMTKQIWLPNWEYRSQSQNNSCYMAGFDNCVY